MIFPSLYAMARKGALLRRTLSSLRYAQGDYRDAATFKRIKTALGEAQRPTHYLAIPPSLFPTVIESLGRFGLAKDARVIVEKPFGRDLASERELNGGRARCSPTIPSSASITSSPRKRS